MDISIADVMAPTAAGLIIWAIKTSHSNRKTLEATLELNRKAAVDAIEKVSGNIGMIGVTVESIKTWSEFHQKQDDERHEEAKSDRDKIWATIERRHTA